MFVPDSPPLVTSLNLQSIQRRKTQVPYQDGGKNREMVGQGSNGAPFGSSGEVQHLKHLTDDIEGGFWNVLLLCWKKDGGRTRRAKTGETSPHGKEGATWFLAQSSN